MELSGLSGLGITLAFAAGLISFLSPCVLPLVPAYLSYVSGVSVETLSSSDRRQTVHTLAATGLFVIGFSIIFIALGISAAYLGSFMVKYRVLLNQVAGGMIILMGLFVLGMVRIPALSQERRFHLGNRSIGLLGSMPLGMAFGFGWTPCVGPILASINGFIIANAATGSAALTQGGILLGVYSLGLGLPFILTALLYARAVQAFTWIKRHFVAINTVAAALLIGMGVLLITGQLGVVMAPLKTYLFNAPWWPKL